MTDSTANSISEWTSMKKFKKKKKKEKKPDVGLFNTIKKYDECEILIKKDEDNKKYYLLKDLISDKLIDYYIISGREQNEFKKENASELNKYLQKNLEYFFKKPLSKDENLKKCIFENIKEEFSDKEYENYPYVLICQQPLICKHCRNNKKIMKYNGNDFMYCYKQKNDRLIIGLHTDLRIYEDNSIIFSPFSMEDTNNYGAPKKATFKYSEKDFPEGEIKSPTAVNLPSWSDRIKISSKIDKKVKIKAEKKAKEEAEKKAKEEAEKKAKEEEEALKKLRKENNNADDGWIDNTQPPKQVKVKRPPTPGLTVLDLIPKYDNESDKEEENAISKRTIRNFEDRFNNIEKQMRRINQFIIQEQNRENHLEKHIEMITNFMKMMNKMQNSIKSSF